MASYQKTYRKKDASNADPKSIQSLTVSYTHASYQVCSKDAYHSKMAKPSFEIYMQVSVGITPAADQ